MKTYRNLYPYLCSMGNLTLAWRKARKEKTGKEDVIEFEKEIERNLLALHYELTAKIYKPRPLVTFVLRDPKTRLISKSDFRDRIVHHALILVIKPFLEKQFICDSCANRIKKGTLYALKRFYQFLRKVSDPVHERGFCLKADIRHYFQEIDHEILLTILKKTIKDAEVIWLIQQILSNTDCVNRGGGERLRGMPLGNYTSQFFANVYLNELDYFVKHKLRAMYYLRYVDDFVILHRSRKQLEAWKATIDSFLREKLRITLHTNKSRIIPIKRGIDFVGFRNFYHCRLLRKRNIRAMEHKIRLYKERAYNFGSIYEVYCGWQAYARWGNTYNLRKSMKEEIVNILWVRAGEHFSI